MFSGENVKAHKITERLNAEKKIVLRSAFQFAKDGFVWGF